MVIIRVAVVLSVACLLAFGPPFVRHHVVAAAATLIVALLYAVFMVGKPDLEIRRTRFSWLVTSADASVSLLVIAFTGGASSPCVGLLMLVVVAAASRLRAVVTLGITVVIGLSYGLMVLLWSDGEQVFIDPVLQAASWLVSLVFTAILTAALSIAAEREQRSRLLAYVEAEAEHAAAEEERDLRGRLLQSYQSQQDGLRVLLHEFRTPLASLEALGEALADEQSPMSESGRLASLHLANDHIHHLNDMLDALGDVALSWRPTFWSGRVRGLDMEELIFAAADAVGLRPPRLRVSISSDGTVVHADGQSLRRVLTNLLDNAARHGGDRPVDVRCAVQDGELCISVMDRGPGVPEESLGELTAKFVSVGDQRGTAGLGLWIVQQILEATGGRLYFTSREGGGLTATFHLPLSDNAGAA